VLQRDAGTAWDDYRTELEILNQPLNFNTIKRPGRDPTNRDTPSPKKRLADIPELQSAEKNESSEPIKLSK
jgi:hypothetical protein